MILLTPGERMKVKLADLDVTIRAARPRVFRLFSSFGKDEQSTLSQPGDNGEGATVPSTMPARSSGWRKSLKARA